MFKVWTCEADSAESLARALEAHLNEFADDVVSVSYQVSTVHQVLAVYRPIEPPAIETAGVLAEAESVLDDA